MRFICIAIVLCLISATSVAQGFRSRFYLPGAFNNTARAIFETSPGSYFAAGFVYDTLKGFYTDRLTILGLDQNGKPQWAKKYGNAKFQYLMNNFICRSFYRYGNYFYHACCVRDSNNKQIGVLIKFDQNGDTIWQKIYRDPVEDVIPQMVTASVDGGFLITGFFQNFTNNTQPALLIKTDSKGNELWRKRLHKASPDVSDGKAILQDSASKKIVIAGYRYLSGAFNYENIVILDSVGNSPANTSFASYGATITDLIQTKNGKIIIVGRQYYPQTIGGENLVKSYAVKFDINSPLQPIWKLDGYDKLGLYNGFTCVKELKNGDLLLGGIIDTIYGVVNGPIDAIPNPFNRITILDNNGKVKWNKYFSYKINDSASSNYQGINSLSLCQDGSWLISISCSNPNPNPFFFVKYDSTGCDSTLAYCQFLQTVGLNEEVNEEAVNVFPNPASTGFNFVYNSKESGKVRLEMKDLTGRLVYSELWDDALIEHHISIKDLSNSMYLVTVMREGRVIYKTKLIKKE